MSFSFHKTCSKSELADELEYHRQTWMQGHHAASLMLFDHLVQDVLQQTRALPTHVAGVRVTLSGHADEHNHSFSIEFSGVHLETHATATDQEAGIAETLTPAEMQAAGEA